MGTSYDEFIFYIARIFPKLGLKYIPLSSLTSSQQLLCLPPRATEKMLQLSVSFLFITAV